MSAKLLNRRPFPLEGRPTLLLADGEFSVFGSKTANCYLRYRSADVVAVLDASNSGRTAEDVLGFGGAVPVVSTVEAGAGLGAELAIVGMAPQGGRIDDLLRSHLVACATLGMDLVSGLHDFVRDDPDIAKAAAKSGARLWDVRWVPPGQVVGTGGGCTTGAKSVLLVGSDCNVGKMTATVELHRAAVARGLKASWAATGQTGMMLRGRGIAVDRVISDFVAGAAEVLVNEEGAGQDLVFVEGQGALVHPGYAPVTLGLLYGTMPDTMVMVHAAERVTIGHSDVSLPPLSQQIAMYETALAPFKVSRVCALALNTAGLEDARARDMIDDAGREAGLPVADPVRDGADVILDAVLADVRARERGR